MTLSQGPTYNLQQRINEYRQALEWVHVHQHLPELLASIYAECFQRGGNIWFDGPMLKRWVELYANIQKYEFATDELPDVRERDIVVICDFNLIPTETRLIERELNVTHIAFFGRKEIWQNSPLAKSVKLPIYVDADGWRAVELAAHMLQLLTAEVVQHWNQKQSQASSTGSPLRLVGS
jgi:hypothetical protein